MILDDAYLRQGTGSLLAPIRPNAERLPIGLSGTNYDLILSQIPTCISMLQCEPFDMKGAKLECPSPTRTQPNGSIVMYIWFHLTFLFVIQWMAHGRPGAHGESVPYLAVLEPNSVIARAKARRMEVPLVRPQARKPRNVMQAFAQVRESPAMDPLTDTSNCGLRMRQECREPFPHHRLQRKPLVFDPVTHHGTSVTQVPWCMSGSLTRGGCENVPGIPGAWEPTILRILKEAHGDVLSALDMSRSNITRCCIDNDRDKGGMDVRLTSNGQKTLHVSPLWLSCGGLLWI